MEPAAPATIRYAPDLRIGYLLGKAWELYKANLGIVVGSSAIYLIVLAIFSGGDNVRFIPAGGSLIWLILAGPVTVGLYGVLVRVVRGEEVSIANMVDGFQQFGRAVGTYILATVAMVVGLLLLIVPGIIVAIGLWPALFLVYDERLPVVETLQRAWDMTRGHKWSLFVLAVVSFFIFVAGFLALFVGVFFTGAFVFLVSAVAYEELALGAA